MGRFWVGGVCGRGGVWKWDLRVIQCFKVHFVKALICDTYPRTFAINSLAVLNSIESIE
jgi:hypothetical protein